MSFGSLKSSAAADVRWNLGRNCAISWHSVSIGWNIIHASRMRRRKPSSIMGIGPEHKMLVPSLVDVGLTESLTSGDPVPQSPHSVVAHSEGLGFLLHAIENMEAGNMSPIWPCSIETPDN